MEKIYRAAKYIRSSCADNECEGRNTIENQSAIIDAFLLEHPDIVVVTERIDENQSGVFFDRPAFNEMMADIIDGKIDCILIKDLSRIGRDYIDAERYLQNIFPMHGVRFISIGDNIDTFHESISGNLFVMIKNILNDQYSREISVKTRTALAFRRKNGEYVGATPIFGYKRSEENRNRLEPDEYAAGIVRLIFMMKLQGTSANKIASQLNESGILSPSAYKYAQTNRRAAFLGGWSATSILRILKNENYTGILVQGRQTRYSYKLDHMDNVPEAQWVKVEDAHKEIIPRADFDAVQQAMKLDTRVAHGEKNINLFSGILKCDCCGKSMIRRVVQSKGKKYCYFACPTGKKNGCATAGRIPEAALFAGTMAAIRKHVQNMIEVHQRIDDIGQYCQWLKKALNSEIQEYEEQVFKNHKFSSGLRYMLLAGLIDREDFNILQDHYCQENKRLQAVLTKAQKDSRIVEKLSVQYDEWVRFCMYHIDLDAIDRFAMVQLIQRIHVSSNGRYHIEFVHQRVHEQAEAFCLESR